MLLNEDVMALGKSFFFIFFIRDGLRREEVIDSPGPV